MCAAELRSAGMLTRTMEWSVDVLTWSKLAGPCYGNQIATLTLDGREARERHHEKEQRVGRPRLR